MIAKYVSVAEMIAIEREADASGLTYAQMMEHAGRGLADGVMEIYPNLKDQGVLGLVGSGNNGGDTLVALDYLARAGWSASAYIVRPRPDSDPLLERLLEAGGEITYLDQDAGYQHLASLLDSHAIWLDGILGTGIRLPLRGTVAEVLEFILLRQAQSPHVHVVAVDCPSGINCDTGDAAPECVPAELTITMAAYKRGLLSFPAADLVGALKLVGIGLGERGEYPQAWRAIHRFVPDDAWVKAVLPLRPRDAHKGTFGTALIAAGSTSYTGAALLAGEAAYRIGAGLVTLAVPQPLHAALAGQFPEATWLLLPHASGNIAKEAVDLVLDQAERCTALLIGPGFGLASETKSFLGELIERKGMELPPLVFDADGLKLLSQVRDWDRRIAPSAVLTPHPGEMSVLSGLSKDEIQADRVAMAERYARQWGHVLVLKGAFTVVAAPDGQTAVLPFATPALARAGTGDVLAGLIAGLRAQGIDAFQAAVAGAWIHARAGLAAEIALGHPAAVLAGDVLSGVIDVLAELN